MSVLAVFLISTGIIFLGVGAIGAIRLPDFFTRAHAMGVLDTLGSLLVLGGIGCAHGFSLVTGKVFLLILFIYIANPTVTHVFVRAAFMAEKGRGRND